MVLKLSLQNIAKAHTWAEDLFPAPMPGDSETRMSFIEIGRRRIQVSYDQHENHSADFYCFPDRVRGVYKESGYLHFAISREATFEGFSFRYLRAKKVRSRETLMWHFTNEPPLTFEEMLRKGAESNTSDESREQVLLFFRKSVAYEILKDYYEGFVARLFAVSGGDTFNRDFGYDESQLAKKKRVIDFSAMSWGMVLLAWNKWCAKGENYDIRSSFGDGWAVFGRTFPECKSDIEFMLHRETVLDIRPSFTDSARTGDFLCRVWRWACSWKSVPAEGETFWNRLPLEDRELFLPYKAMVLEPYQEMMDLFRFSTRNKRADTARSRSKRDN